MELHTKVLLYSGGMDSWLIDKIWKPDVKLYINIHGDYNESELRRLPEDVKIIDCPFLSEFELHDTKFLPLRNLYFLMMGSHFGDRVCIGATGGDWGNKDKTPEFLYTTEHLLRYLWSDKKVNRSIDVEDRFVYIPKSDLLRQYIAHGGTADEVKEETFSCYTPIDDKECFDCYPCFRKFALLYANGATYTEEECYKMWKYVKKNIIPTKEEGGYAGTYYTDRGKESEDLIKAVHMLKEKYDVK